MGIEVERRPLLLSCLSLAVGIAAVQHPLVAALILPVVLLKGLTPKLVAACAFALGVLISPEPVEPILQERFFNGVVTIASIPDSYDWTIACRVDAEIKGKPIPLAMSFQRGDLGLGDEVHVIGPIKPLNEGSIRGRVAGRVEAERIEVVRRGPAWARIGMSWRRSFLAFAQQNLGQRAAEIVGALCFNADNVLDKELRDNLQRTGTVHIVSTSGLHVMIVAFGIHGLLSFLPMPRWGQLAVLLLALGLYACATGLDPPIIRSSVMAMIYFSAYVFRREPDILSALAASAILYLLWRPAALFEIGFQLSFLTVAFMGLFIRPWPETPTGPLPRISFQIKQLAIVSLIATLGSMPLVAYHFGIVSIISVLANLLIAVVLAPLILTAMLSLWLMSLVPGVAVGAMRLIVEPLAGWILAVVDSLGSLSFAAVEVPPFNAYWLVPIYVAALMTWRKHARQP